MPQAKPGIDFLLQFNFMIFFALIYYINAVLACSVLIYKATRILNKVIK